MTSRTRSTRRPQQRPAQTESEQPQTTEHVPSTELVLFGEPIEVEDDTKPGKTKRAWVNTPYQACKVLNAMIAEAGIEKVIPGPMVYTYAKNGKFVTFIAADGTGRKVVDPESFMTWAAGYIVSLQAKIAKQAAKVEADQAAA